MRDRPVVSAFLAAALFGAAAPVSKLLLSGLSPFQLAGLLYLGAACGIAWAAMRGGGIHALNRTSPQNRFRLLGAIVAGGICGPVLLLLGLRLAPASSVSLWLSFELAATALLGVVLFRDHLGPAGWAGVVSALTGSVLLSRGADASGPTAGGVVLLACLCWGMDNQLSALIDDMTPAQITFWKCFVAGTANLVIGLIITADAGRPLMMLAALLLGGLSYGASIMLYLSSARSIGATRAQTAFASAPYFGVVLSVPLLGESLTPVAWGSAALFLLGLTLLSLERHAHTHRHHAIRHDHAHRHDDGHHDHAHPNLPPSTVHAHQHTHEVSAHAHPHRPDLHHRHTHGSRS